MKPTLKTSLARPLIVLRAVLSLLILGVPLLPASGQGTAFSYQGRLSSGGVLLTGLYDFQFTAFDAVANGNQVGATVTITGLGVTNGVFNATPDFGASVFTGPPRWLQVAARVNGSSGAYAIIGPPLPTTSTPYAIQALTAATVATVPNSALPTSPTFSGTVTSPDFQSDSAGDFVAGTGNTASGGYSAVGGGDQNIASGPEAFIGGGGSNIASGDGSVVAGGILNIASGDGSVVAGGGLNTASGIGSVVSGGGAYGYAFPNTASGDWSTVTGGTGNTASGRFSVVGGEDNNAGGEYSVASGGRDNGIFDNADHATIGGGFNNHISGYESTIAGGENNQINAPDSVIGGGDYNLIVAGANQSFIGGGLSNTNVGTLAAIPGGDQNVATNNSFAAGHRAKAVNPGTFVWADSQGADFASTTSNQFLVRAQGGVQFVTGGAGLTVDGVPVLTTSSGNQTGNSFTDNGSGLTNIPLSGLADGGVLGLVTNGVSFRYAGSAPVGDYPKAMVAATNINGLGHVDLVAANYIDQTLTVLTNNGHGGFATYATLPVAGYPYAVAAADVNGDGRVDLICVFSSYYVSYNTLCILTNNGNGGFGFYTNVTVGNNPNSVVATDINGDGQVDLVCANGSDNTLSIMTNNGHGFFGLYATPAVGIEPSSVVAADLNDDGQVDLACVNYEDNTVSVLINTGNKTFRSATYSAGTGPWYLAAADVNGDGSVDLVAGDYYDGTVTVLTNLSNGSFLLASAFASPNTPGGNGISIAGVVDVNGDGKPDLVCCDSDNYYGSYGGLQIFLNPGNGNFAASQEMDIFSVNGTSIVAYSGLVLDLNGDGKPDLAIGTYNPDSLVVLTNTTGSSSALLTIAGQNGGLSLIPGQNGVPNVLGGSSANAISTSVSGAVIAGGGSLGVINEVSSDDSSIGGGAGNDIQSFADHSFIGAGLGNTIGISGEFSFIGGGSNNLVASQSIASVIAGGQSNSVLFSADHAFIGGGQNNLINSYASASVIVGGQGNGIGQGSDHSFIGGGWGNLMNSGRDYDSVIVGGQNNTNNGQWSFIGGGENNLITGLYATIPGGAQNLASGLFSLAAGQQANAGHQGAFVWADSQNAAFASTSNDQFLIRAQGGVGINMNHPNGASLYVQGNRTNGWASSMGWFENTSTATNVAPALRVVCDGGTNVDGALSVSANGGGLIAEFGNGGGFVVTITNNGTITAGGFVGNGSGLTGLNFSQLSGGVIPQSALPASPDFASTVTAPAFLSDGKGDFVAGTRNTASGGNASVGGGNLNSASGGYSTVGGGFDNTASGDGSTVGGGWYNLASGELATVGGGGGDGYYGDGTNIASAYAATVAGGTANQATNSYATVTGGGSNTAGGLGSTVAGGQDNTASGGNASVGGGNLNSASGGYSTVGGGLENTASQFATVAGGDANVARGAGSTVAGGEYNNAAALFAFIGGGGFDSVSADFGVVAGGIANNSSGPGDFIGGGGFYGSLNDSEDYSQGNYAAGADSVVVGGLNNVALTDFASVGGGLTNSAMAIGATVGGGSQNTAGGHFASDYPGSIGNGYYATVGGGLSNNATASGATVAGGFQNTASGLYSFAAGQQANAANQGAFVWADSQNSSFTSTANDQFLIRSQGGVGINTNSPKSAALTVSGAIVASGTVTANGVLLTSDRNVKENFKPLDSQSVLAKVAALPITGWNYKDNDVGIRHVGPMAQDFHTAFGLDGADDTHISVVDETGVALAAIQGLNQKLQQKDAEIQQLQQSVAELQALVKQLATLRSQPATK